LDNFFYEISHIIAAVKYKAVLCNWFLLQCTYFLVFIVHQVGFLLTREWCSQYGLDVRRKLQK